VVTTGHTEKILQRGRTIVSSARNTVGIEIPTLTLDSELSKWLATIAGAKIGLEKLRNYMHHTGLADGHH